MQIEVAWGVTRRSGDQEGKGRDPSNDPASVGREQKRYSEGHEEGQAKVTVQGATLVVSDLPVNSTHCCPVVLIDHLVYSMSELFPYWPVCGHGDIPQGGLRFAVIVHLSVCSHWSIGPVQVTDGAAQSDLPRVQ